MCDLHRDYQQHITGGLIIAIYIIISPHGKCGDLYVFIRLKPPLLHGSLYGIFLEQYSMDLVQTPHKHNCG